MTREERALSMLIEVICVDDPQWGEYLKRKLEVPRPTPEQSIAAMLAFADAEAAAMRERAARAVESPDLRCPGLPNTHWTRQHVMPLATAIRALPITEEQP